MLMMVIMMCIKIVIILQRIDSLSSSTSRHDDHNGPEERKIRRVVRALDMIHVDRPLLTHETTFTHYTTRILEGTKSTIISRVETVTNIATDQIIRPTRPSLNFPKATVNQRRFNNRNRGEIPTGRNNSVIADEEPSGGRIRIPFSVVTKRPKKIPSFHEVTPESVDHGSNHTSQTDQPGRNTSASYPFLGSPDPSHDSVPPPQIQPSDAAFMPSDAIPTPSSTPSLSSSSLPRPPSASPSDPLLSPAAAADPSPFSPSFRSSEDDHPKPRRVFVVASASCCISSSSHPPNSRPESPSSSSSQPNHDPPAGFKRPITPTPVTYYTTFTYFTAELSAGQTIIRSREQVISTVIRGKVLPTRIPRLEVPKNPPTVESSWWRWCWHAGWVRVKTDNDD